MNIVDRLFGLFDAFGDESYGEDITQREHALQCAHLAQLDGADDSLVTAALLHDIGQFIEGAGEMAELAGIDAHHEARGAAFLRPYYDEAVVAPILMHVEAKRYLCAVEPGYADKLSRASALSLRLQGGPFAHAEAESFARHPHFESAIRLRRYDDTGKITGLAVPPLETYRDLLATLLRS